MRQEGAGDHRHAFARYQFLGDADRFARIAAVVTDDQFNLLAVDALGVHFLERQLHALLVGIEEGGLRLVAVQFADLDRVLGNRREA